MMKKVLLIAFVIGVVIFVSLAGDVWLKEKASHASPQPAQKTITIVDSAKRQVRVSWPVKRVVALCSDVAAAIVALGAKDTIVGISKYALGEPWAPTVTNIGCSSHPNFEAIIATKPDVVITYVRWPSSEALEKKLEPLGIKVVRFDFYKIEALFTEIKSLGRLLNKEKKADELIRYWQGQLNLIKERIKKLKPQEQVRVYWESGDYSAAGPGSGWNEILKCAGGINIFAESPVPYPKISPEAVVKKNPDVILKNVSETKFDPWGATNPAFLKELHKTIITRPGWNAINAVKKGKVYIICSGYLHEVFGLVAEVSYVAKIFYPNLFADFNPAVLHKRWLSDLGIEFKGLWIYPPLK